MTEAHNTMLILWVKHDHHAHLLQGDWVKPD